jgi:hypothetical protein
MHLTKISLPHDIERKNTMRASAPRFKLDFNNPETEPLWSIREETKFEREYANFKLSKLSKMEKIWFKLTKYKKNDPGIPLSYFYNYVKLDQTNLIRNLLK